MPLGKKEGSNEGWEENGKTVSWGGEERTE